MIQTIYLREFFKYGHFGLVRLGMTCGEVTAKLGPPEWGGYWWSWQDPSEPELPIETCPVWNYGPFDLYWEEKTDQLAEIYCDHLELLRRPSKSVKVSPWVFRSAKPVLKAQFEAALQRQKIDYAIEDYQGAFGLLMLASGVTVAYEYEEDSKDQISMISYPAFNSFLR